MAEQIQKEKTLKIFVIGGNALPVDDPSFADHNHKLTEISRQIGRQIAEAGHDLVICSPFSGSIDVEAMSAVLEVRSSNQRSEAKIDFYYPNHPSVQSQFDYLTSEERLNMNMFPQPLSGGDMNRSPTENDWLLCQLVAMERSHAIIAMGGKQNGTASMLLLLAENRRKVILPLTFLQGAADQSYQRRQYELLDRLADKVAVLRDEKRINEVLSLLELLTSFCSNSQSDRPKKKFFLSYPRSRPEEADFIEMTLRRRNCEVFRDERDFGAGQQLINEIDEYIHQADVFVAVWCSDYACSPWCFDELTLALQLKAAGKLEIWLFCVDGTRVVPPDARSIISYPSIGRNAIERQLLVLLERKSTNVTTKLPRAN